MNREILFKAKRSDNGEWVIGNLVWSEDADEDYQALIIPTTNSNMYTRDSAQIEDADIGFETWYTVDPSTICQYTGLKDKNGKRIWENDVVSNKWCFACGNSVVKFGEYKDFHMQEKYQCGNLGFFLEHLDDRDSRCVRKDLMYFAGKCEVVGNIFDNLELLEKRKDD